jgi:hypothetical protein
MAREIRITIDDDEIFERMKRRKDELDLSWEEVLRRGLDRDESESGNPGSANPGSASEPGASGRHGTPGRQGTSGHHGTHGPHSSHSSHASSRGSHSSRDSHPSHGHRDTHASASEGNRRDPGDWNPFAPDFGRKLSEHITRSVAESVPGGEEFVSGSLEDEIDQLEDAEDAVLAFPFLDDDPDNQVPLRVNLRTSAGGLDVEVVAVRRGKDASSMNRFAGDARGTVTRKLAAGEPAVLRMGNGGEEYPVLPTLSWSRDRDGRPTVTEVEILDVRLDEE